VRLPGFPEGREEPEWSTFPAFEGHLETHARSSAGPKGSVRGSKEGPPLQARAYAPSAIVAPDVLHFELTTLPRPSPIATTALRLRVGLDAEGRMELRISG
jgi:hypothetical protein